MALNKFIIAVSVFLIPLLYYSSMQQYSGNISINDHQNSGLENHKKSNHFECSLLYNRKERLITWHKMNTAYEGVHMYFMSHSYQDQRFPNKTHTIIYMTANGDLAQYGTNVQNPGKFKSIYCHFQFEDGDVISSAAKAIIGVGTDYEIGNYKYKEFYAICETDQANASSISISFDKYFSMLPKIKILQPFKDFAGSLGLCVPSLYGNFTTDAREIVAFIEYMEIYRMFGTSEISVYILKIGYSSKFESVLNYYTSMGLVKVINQSISDLKLTPNDIGDASIIFNKGVTLDCMYRNMMRFDFIFIGDWDDIVVPRTHESFPEMLRTVTMNENFSYCIGMEPKDYTLDIPQDKSVRSSSKLITSKYLRYRTGTSYPIKSIIQPKKCLITDNHGCKPLTQDYEGIETKISRCEFSAPEYVTTHHYRRICDAGHVFSKNGSVNILPKKGRKCAKSNITEDHIMKRFEEYLTKQVNNVLNILNLKSLQSY